MNLIQTIDECCPALQGAPLSPEEAQTLASAFRAIAEPARLRLLSLICASPQGTCCVCDLTAPLGLTQPTVSHHLKVLHDAGLLERERRGTWAYYRVVPGALKTLQDALRYEGAAYAPKDE